MRREIPARVYGVTNPTTRTGKIVHAPNAATGALSGYPACDRYMYGIVYTDEPVNCPACLKKQEES